MAQTVKSLPAMREAWVRSLDQEDPLEKEMATRSSILAWKIPATVQGVAKSRTRLSDFTSLYEEIKYIFIFSINLFIFKWSILLPSTLGAVRLWFSCWVCVCLCVCVCVADSDGGGGVGVWNGYDPWRRGSVLGQITVTSFPNNWKSWEPAGWGDPEPGSFTGSRPSASLSFPPIDFQLILVLSLDKIEPFFFFFPWPCFG